MEHTCCNAFKMRVFVCMWCVCVRVSENDPANGFLHWNCRKTSSIHFCSLTSHFSSFASLSRFLKYQIFIVCWLLFLGSYWCSGRGRSQGSDGGKFCWSYHGGHQWGRCGGHSGSGVSNSWAQETRRGGAVQGCCCVRGRRARRPRRDL